MPNTQLLMEMEQVFQRLFRKKISDWNKTIERDLSGSQALILLMFGTLYGVWAQRVTVNM